MLTNIAALEQWLSSGTVGQEIIFFDQHEDLSDIHVATRDNPNFAAVYQRLMQAESERQVYLAADANGRYMAMLMAKPMPHPQPKPKRKPKAKAGECRCIACGRPSE
jgi:hypothetical protein